MKDEKVLPRGLNGLKCLAVASVYATHMHYVPMNLRTQAISSVSHFFLYSGLLAYLSLKTPLSQTRLFSEEKTTFRNMLRFLTRDLWITWIVFLLRRCLVIFIYFQVWHYMVVVHSPSYNPAILYPERRLFTHFWAHWWKHPTGRQLSGSPHLWFLSPVSFFWMLSTPVVALLLTLPDVLVILFAAAFGVFSLYAIKLVPSSVAEWTVYYFSPQTHWVAYALGLFMWRARDSSLMIKAFDKPWLQRRNILTWCLFPLVVDIMSYVFAWWNWHVIVFRTRTGDDFIDPLYRTTTFMAAIVFIWSTSIANNALTFRFANAKYWDMVAPGSVKLAIYVTQWSIGYIIIPHMKDRTGRVLCLIVVYYASLLSEALVLRPVREIVTPWLDWAQQYAASPTTIKAKTSSLTESKLSNYLIP